MTEYTIDNYLEGENDIVRAQELDANNQPNGNEVILRNGLLAYVYSDDAIISYAKDGSTVQSVSIGNGEYTITYADENGNKLKTPRISEGMDDNPSLTPSERAEILRKAEAMTRRVARIDVPTALGNIGRKFPEIGDHALAAYQRRDAFNRKADEMAARKKTQEASGRVQASTSAKKSSTAQGSRAAQAPKKGQKSNDEDPNLSVAMGRDPGRKAYEGSDQSQTKKVANEAAARRKAREAAQSSR